MTHQEIPATIESLPKGQQFALATSILDRLASEGTFPVSDDMRAEFERREKAFDANSNQGKPWDQVKSDARD